LQLLDQVFILLGVKKGDQSLVGSQSLNLIWCWRSNLLNDILFGLSFVVVEVFMIEAANN
jgi:hypothetical protein